MPWTKGDYPPSYKNQPDHIKEKAVEIANEILKESRDEGLAIATGLKKHANISTSIQKKIPAKMKTANSDQLKGYLEKLTAMLAAEKKYISCLKSLSAAAFTDELRMGLSPESSDQQMHLQRLGLCIEHHKIKKTLRLPEADHAMIDTASKAAKGKERTLEKDLTLLKAGQQMYRRKSDNYKVLHKMANSLGLEQSARLLEQCFRDDQNASNYLLQVSRNIIAPKVA